MKKVCAIIALAAVGAVAASCASETGAEAPTNVQMRGTSVADASERIAVARCNFEQKCGNIGVNEEYKDRNHCLQDVRQERRVALSDDCEYGVSKSDLSDCLTEIGNQDCSGVGMAVDVLERSFECSSGELCLD